jgi:glycosyltransferase involved in cell wall biosynthesis
MSMPSRRIGKDASRSIIHGIGWVDGPFGYNVHARGFFSALSRHATTVVSPLIEREGPYIGDRELIRAAWPDQRIITIALMYGNLTEEVLRGAPGLKVAFTVWESTKLPDDWIPALKAADQVWTASRWGAAVMARNGINPQCIHVIPEGIDPRVFHPDAPPTTAIGHGGDFKFLHIGRFEDRKNTKTLIRAFDAEFGPMDDVILVLACHNPHQADFDISAELRSLRLAHPEKLVFIPPVARHDVLAELYPACDAFVAPSRAEGWGLPITEAMACDLPVITTGHSAPLDYLGPESYRVSSTMTPVATPFFDSLDNDHGMWAEPDPKDLRAHLRHVYENRTTAKSMGGIAGRRIRSNFTWDRAAKHALLALGMAG